MNLYELFEYSPWAAPIVPFQKSDLCKFAGLESYSKQVTQCDKYPWLRTEDLLATLNGGKRFLKSDLHHVYQQLVLDEGSGKYLCKYPQRFILTQLFTRWYTFCSRDLSKINGEAFKPCSFYSIKNGRYLILRKNDNGTFSKFGMF